MIDWSIRLSPESVRVHWGSGGSAVDDAAVLGHRDVVPVMVMMALVRGKVGEVKTGNMIGGGLILTRSDCLVRPEDR